MVRLYVGGLASDVTSEQLGQRFQPFGTVTNCKVLPPKSNDTRRLPGYACRGFGYVELETPSDAVLRKCLSVYNGSKWRGGVLTVQPAKAHYLSKLKEEWEQEQKREAEKREPKIAHPTTAYLEPLILTRPDGTTVKTEPQRRKTFFPVIRSKPLHALSWGGLPPTSAIIRKEAFTAQMTETAQMADIFGAAENKRACQQDGDPPKVAAKSVVEPQSSESLGAVDFMEDGEQGKIEDAADLSRFSEEEEGPVSNAPSKRQKLHRQKDAESPGSGNRAQQLQPLHGSKTAAQGTLNPAPEGLKSIAAAEDDAEALWQQQGGIEQYLAALGQEEEAEASSSMGSDLADSEADQEQPDEAGPADVAPDSSHSEQPISMPPSRADFSSSDEEEQRNASLEEILGDPQASTSDEGEKEDSEASSASSAPEGGEIGLHAERVSQEDAASQEGGQRQSKDPSTASEGGTKQRDEGQSLAGWQEQEQADAEDIILTQEALPGAQDDDLEEQPQTEVALLFPGASRLEEKWRAMRDTATADWKRKRRDALKHSTGTTKRRSKH